MKATKKYNVSPNFAIFLIISILAGSIALADGNLEYYKSGELKRLDLMRSRGLVGNMVGLWTKTNWTEGFAGTQGTIDLSMKAEIKKGLFNLEGVGTITY